MKQNASLDAASLDHCELLERERELSGLIDLARTNTTAGGRIALIYGDAGIGKTSLITRFVEKIRSTRTVMIGRCDPFITARPFGPLYDMDERLRLLLDAKEHQARSRSDIFGSLARGLAAIDGDIILVIEDAHWIDPSSADFLRYLGRRISEFGLLVVISYRNDHIATGHPLRSIIGEFPHRRVVRFPLSPLSVESIALLSGYDSERALAVHGMTGGNPFYVGELLASGGCLSDSMFDLIAARLEGQSSQLRKIVEIVSVSPRPVSTHLLHQVAGDGAVDHALAAVETGFLKEFGDGHFSLPHELARLAIYERLPQAQRRQWHQAYREVMARSNNSSYLAAQVYHADAASDADAVLETALKAANAASRIGSHAEAFDHLSVALKYLSDADDRTAAKIQEQWAGAACVSNSMGDAVTNARSEAARIWLDLGENLRAADNLRWLSRLYWYRCEPDHAREQGLRSIELLADDAGADNRALARALQAQLLFLDYRMEEAIETARSALAQSRRVKFIEGEIHALNTLGSARCFLGEQEGVEQIKESLALAERATYGHYASRDADIARGYLNLADHAANYRDFVLANDVITQGCRRCSEIDFEAWVMQLTGRRADIFLEQGRVVEASQLAEQVLAYPAMSPQAAQRVKLVLAKVARNRGAKEAGQLLEDCLDLGRRSEDTGFEISVRLALIEWAFLHQDHHRANLELDRISKLPDGCFHEWNAALYLAWHTHYRGPGSPAIKRPISQGFQLEINGEYESAFEWFKKSNLPFEAAFCGLRNVQHFSNEAGQLRNLITSLDAEALEKQFGRSLRNHGKDHKPRHKRGPYKAAQSHPLGLTGKEVEVLAYVQQGFTNREIASSLNRSVRTVDRHVSALIRKLEVSSRVEIVVRLSNEPWILTSTH